MFYVVAVFFIMLFTLPFKKKARLSGCEEQEFSEFHLWIYVSLICSL